MRLLIAALALFAAASSATAQLSIEVTGAGAQRLPIAIAPFAGESALPAGISSIVRADLERSGLFRGVEVPPLSPAPTENTPVNYGEWRSRLADALVLGSVSANPDGRFEVRFRVYDIVKQARSAASHTRSRRARCGQPRIAFPTCSELTGEKGVLDRIVYVVKRGTRFEPQIVMPTARARKPRSPRSSRPFAGASLMASALRTCRSRTRNGRLRALAARRQAPRRGESRSNSAPAGRPTAASCGRARAMAARSFS
jgi:TolB protein